MSIWGKTCDSKGNVIVDEIVLVSDIVGNKIHPDGKSLPDGNVMIVFES